MPRRAAPGNREALEAALSPTDRAALRGLCQRLDAAPDRWHTLPLFRVFVAGAVLNLAGELQRNGSCREHAIMTAAVRCGIPFETVRTWQRRARPAVQDEPATSELVAVDST